MKIQPNNRKGKYSLTIGKEYLSHRYTITVCKYTLTTGMGIYFTQKPDTNTTESRHAAFFTYIINKQIQPNDGMGHRSHR